MADHSTCMSCGFAVDGIVKTCPQCGGVMRSSRTIRALGWVMLISGLTAFALMGSMFWTFSRGSPFTGTSGQAAFFIGAFSILVLFVLLGSVESLFMIVTGRTNRRLVRTMLLVLGLIILGMVLLRVIASAANLLSAFRA